MPPPLRAGAACRELTDRLRQSSFFQSYLEAFETSTGLPLALNSPESLALAHQGVPNQNPFCELMAADDKSCSRCLEVQQRAQAAARRKTASFTCYAGLCESAVPVRVGDCAVAFLQVGQVLLSPPNERQFARTARVLSRLGVKPDLKRAKQTYFQTPVLSRRQYAAVLRLLAIFAQHLAAASNKLMISAERPDPPLIAKAKAYIASRIDEEITLALVARAVNTSTFYFCKVFRRSTGLHFLDYVARIRVERAKALLVNPNSRISETAFAAGFHSLSQFNRVFKRIVGEPPRVWRERISR